MQVGGGRNTNAQTGGIQGHFRLLVRLGVEFDLSIGAFDIS